MADRITDFEDRLKKMETEFARHVREFRVFRDETFVNFQTDLSDKLDTITFFVSGANTVFGLAKRHWRRLIYFGAGLFTAAGIGNPKVNEFISGFFGG